jgi:hypothetical protein
MIENKKKFSAGVSLLAGFAGVLVFVFLPVFNGENGLALLDSLYNSISKGSANFIPKLEKEIKGLTGSAFEASFVLKDEKQAEEAAPLFVKGGAGAEVSGKELKVRGDLGAVLVNCLEDTSQMFENKGEGILEKYGYAEKRVLYNWWTALQALEKSLTKQERFAEAKAVSSLAKKGVEPSYNYYKIEPQKISDRIGVVTFSLVFYVIYTIWYGFAILLLFEGWGIRLEH